MYNNKSLGVTVKSFDKLTTKKELYEKFEKKTALTAGLLSGVRNLDGFYNDKEFMEVAKKLEPLAENTAKILKDVLTHIPEPYVKKYYEDKAREIVESVFSDAQSYPEAVGIYTAVLLYALQNGDYISYIKSGFTIPERRAAKRAFDRYMVFKEEENKKRAEFEKTQEYRIQLIEMKSGIRDHIDYPE